MIRFERLVAKVTKLQEQWQTNEDDAIGALKTENSVDRL
jgi:hypothetical protein